MILPFIASSVAAFKRLLNGQSSAESVIHCGAIDPSLSRPCRNGLSAPVPSDHALKRPDRFRQSSLDRPAHSESAVQCHGLNRQLTRPLSPGLRSSSKSEPSISSRVIALNQRNRPVAVARLIPKFVVAPLDGMTRSGTRPHVRKEMLEGFPSVAHFDASPTVPWKRAMVRIVASSPHPNPASVFRSRAGSVRRRAISPQATAALRVSAFEIVFHRRHGLSARAKANPSAAPTPPVQSQRSFGNNRETTLNLPDVDGPETMPFSFHGLSYVQPCSREFPARVTRFGNSINVSKIVSESLIQSNPERGK